MKFEELREAWEDIRPFGNKTSVAYVADWLRFLYEDTDVESEALEEVAAFYPADEWSNLTRQGQRLLLADVVYSDRDPAAIARDVMSSYDPDKDFGRLARYASVVGVAPLWAVRAEVIVDLDNDTITKVERS